MASQDLTVFVNGKAVEFKTARPQVLTGRTLVPLRGIFESIGAYVEYDEANHTIKATKNNEDVELRLGARIARKNGAEIMLDIKPQVYAGTTMVPLRFIAEALGAKVEFDKANNRINITTSE
ncbi:copper amine oxidase domain-containing protein [Fimbriimonas ginsengisoli Gsoil 348]|uniref:Copper amine oxidase domain-containing protein n=2 Tax=Fimbriimonas ginsengisoli TaxID=1005039 RepID=A0A068NVF4_FIMGI|nr:copper amine oxidase domain-containing protein [Fimbriimonas ginsengisoli Gsoil 348]